jgi:hypothetical protein
MTVSIPPVTFPGPGTSRELTGRPQTSGLVLIMSRPAATAPGYGRQPAPPRWPGDRSSLWLPNAAAGLCVLAAAAAAVSFTAQYRMVDATRHLPVVAALEVATPDVAALVFACLGIALALHGRRALRAQALNLASVGASVFMNAIAAAPGWPNLAIWAMPPIAYALASDTLIGVVRAWVLARHRQLTAALAGEEGTRWPCSADKLMAAEGVQGLSLAPCRSTLSAADASVHVMCGRCIKIRSGRL